MHFRLQIGKLMQEVLWHH